MAWTLLHSWLLPPRSAQLELLDADEIAEPDLQGNLDDLRRLNGIMGSRWLVVREVEALWQRAGRPSRVRILDIGTGAGDMLLALRRWGHRQGITLTIVGLDTHRGTLRYAAVALHRAPEVTLVRANGLYLPCREQAFDIVLCSTMFHHLQPPQAIALLRSTAAAARCGVIVNDLLRSRLHYYGARLLLPLLTHNRLTRHDGPLSVLRAYTLAEIRAMAEAAGWHTARVRVALGYRFLLVYAHA
jgi:2-polyprenyl-3-methyl-5-hydroxy-6-metoxy-1,4-benzoquinol methylase